MATMTSESRPYWDKVTTMLPLTYKCNTTGNMVVMHLPQWYYLASTSASEDDNFGFFKIIAKPMAIVTRSMAICGNNNTTYVNKNTICGNRDTIL